MVSIGKGIGLVTVCFICFGCATAKVATLSAAGSYVKVIKSDPAGNCQEVGPLEGISGSGCGGFGSKGTYEGSYTQLKNNAADRGANVVRIDAQSEPHLTGGCFDNKFTLRGVAFKCE